MNKNPIINAIVARGISLPEKPVDLSGIFRDLGIRRVYLIAMTGRCGSTWLATELAALPHSGNPVEYFSEEGIPHFASRYSGTDILEFFAAIINHGTADNVFGFKIDAMRLSWLSKVVDLKASFPEDGVQWVDMRRLNIVKQAFSYARAKETGVWHVFDTGTSQANVLTDSEINLTLQGEKIWKEITRILESEKFLDDLYKEMEITPFKIKYEELVDSKAQILRRIFYYLFPKRDFPVSTKEDVRKTTKLIADSTQSDELAFVQDNAKMLNKLYSERR